MLDTHDAQRPLNIPNLITVGRVILVPVVFWLLVSGPTQAAFFAFVVAGICGRCRRVPRQALRLDYRAWRLPRSARRQAVACVDLCRDGRVGELPSWLVIGVVTRDIMIVAAVVLSWLMDHPVSSSGRWPSARRTRRGVFYLRPHLDRDLFTNFHNLFFIKCCVGFQTSRYNF